MNNMIDEVMDVTIAYPEGAKTFWQFLCGEVTRVKVDIRILPVTAELTGDYFEDDLFRDNFQNWVNELWKDKDEQLARMLDIA